MYANSVCSKCGTLFLKNRVGQKCQYCQGEIIEKKEPSMDLVKSGSN